MREGNTGGGRTYGGTIGTNITFFFSRFPDAYVNEIYGSCFCILGRFGRCWRNNPNQNFGWRQEASSSNRQPPNQKQANFSPIHERMQSLKTPWRSSCKVGEIIQIRTLDGDKKQELEPMHEEENMTFLKKLWSLWTRDFMSKSKQERYADLESRSLISEQKVYIKAKQYKEF
ncbi:hypothetical protein JHK84_045173 [Glycine max]|nr:hypothetical protein JHK86_045114 [Glycine max]KAG5108266.1 hypothetical protein JHK84_045173 [Glycine max]